MSLRLEQVGKEIDGRWLVRDVSLSIESAQVTALVGPNGSGKSTVLRLLAGLWRPTNGRAAMDGVDLTGMARRLIARRVAFVPQDTHVGFAFSVREVVEMGRHPHIGRFEAPGPKDAAAVEEALDRADVTHLADRLVNELSGGERQRVVLARSLATEAQVILLDEPTSNLDIDHSLETFKLLKDLANEGKAVAVALHDLNAVARWADHAALMHAGRLRDCGPVRDILRDELVESVFGVDVERIRSATGAETLVFHHRSARSGP